MDALILRKEQPDAVEVQALLEHHFALMRASSPEESCHVMSSDTLQQKGVTLFAAWQDATVVGVGALAQIGPHHGELKSMHTAQNMRGRGVGRTILRALMSEARVQGFTQVSLETGAADMFAPARTLYAAEGFAPCPPFGDYVADPLSVFMTVTLG